LLEIASFGKYYKPGACDMNKSKRKGVGLGKETKENRRNNLCLWTAYKETVLKLQHISIPKLAG